MPDVYTLDLEPEALAVVAAKYSRSAEPARDVAATLLQEGEEAARGGTSAWHEKYTLGYGHASVAELAVVGAFIEGISQPVVKIIERQARGAYSEQSTRYQTMSPDLVANPFHPDTEQAVEFDEAVRRLFAVYDEILEKGEEYVERALPEMKKTQARIAVHDAARYCLPLGLKANLAAVMDARAWARVLRDLRSAPYQEANHLAPVLQKVLSEKLPTLLRYTDVAEGRAGMQGAVRRFIKMVDEGPGQSYGQSAPAPHDNRVVVLPLQKDTETIYGTLVEGLIGEHGTGTGFRHLPVSPSSPSAFNDVNLTDANKLLLDVVSQRTKRHADIPQAFHLVPVVVRLVTDIGAWRDLQRHRRQEQSAAPFSCAYGYRQPPMVEEIGMAGAFRDVMLETYAAHRRLAASPEKAEYLVPFAYRVPYSWTTTLGELIYICELRSGMGGHESYRWVAQEIARQLLLFFPFLAPMWSGERSLVCWD